MARYGELTHSAPTLFAALLIACQWTGLAEAQPPASQNYPSQPVKWILPGPPGSPPDLAARMLGDRLASVLGQPVVIENRPGAGGTIALAAVAKAPPDGHTIGMFGVNHVIAGSLLPQLPYDTLKDFSPVTQLVIAMTVLVVSSDSPYKSVADILAAANANPGRMTYSSAGNATPSHLAGELFRAHAGINISHVPYKGPPAAAAAVLGRQVDMAFIGAASVAPHLKSGALRGLGTPAPNRPAAWPDLPTMRELGFPEFEMRDWIGIVVPSATPKERIVKLAGSFASVLDRPDVNDRLALMGMEKADHFGPAEFGALIRSEIPRLTRIVRDARIRAE